MSTDLRWHDSHVIRFEDDEKPYCLHCDARKADELEESCLYSDALDIFGDPTTDFDWMTDDDKEDYEEDESI